MFVASSDCIFFVEHGLIILPGVVRIASDRCEVPLRESASRLDMIQLCDEAWISLNVILAMGDFDFVGLPADSRASMIFDGSPELRASDCSVPVSFEAFIRCRLVCLLLLLDGFPVKAICSFVLTTSRDGEE